MVARKGWDIRNLKEDPPRTEELKNILSKYKSEYKLKEKRDNYYLLEDLYGKEWALVETAFKPERVELLAHVSNYIIQNGFHNNMEIILNKQMNAVTNHCEINYFMIPFIEGSKLNSADIKEVSRLCADLARFHKAALGYTPPKNFINVLQKDNWLDKYQSRFVELLEYKYEAKENYKSDFDGVFLESFDYFYDQAQEALLEMSILGFNKIFNKYIELGSIGQNAFRPSHFRMLEGNIVFVHPYNWIWQIPVIDFGTLLALYLPRFDWDKEVALILFNSYYDIFYLSQAEIDILLAYLKLPKRFWQYANYYYRVNHTQNNELVQKLIAYKKGSNKRMDCIVSLKKAINGGE